MLVNRLAFLALATSMSTIACSSTTPAEDEEGSDEGAIVGGDRACSTPDKDAEIPVGDLRICDTMANNALQYGEDYASIHGTCNGYLTNYKPFARAKVLACMKALKPVDIPRDDGPEAFAGGRMFDWSGLYSCGFEAIRQTCASEEIASKCAELIARPGHAPWTSDPAVKPQQECQEFLSALTAAGKTQVIKCMTESKFSASSCIEGLRADWQAPVCWNPDERGGKRRADSASSCEALGTTAKSVCLQFMNAMRAPMAAVYSDSLVALAKASTETTANSVYVAAVRSLRGTCSNPAVVDPMCRTLVNKWQATQRDVNKGGRLTRECRALFPGLLQSARDRVMSAPVPADGKIASALVALPNPPSAAELEDAAE